MIHLDGRISKMSRTLFLFSALTLLISIIFVGPASAINGDAWADDMADWGYRVPITITNPPTSANVQREINLTYQENMQADFDDIRFRTSSGSSIDYWIEEKTDSSYANVWVELPSANMTYIYAYYGNDIVSTAGNVSNVFVLYDSFDGTSLNTEIWEDRSNSGNNPSVNNGALELYVSSANKNTGIRSINSIGNNTIVDISVTYHDGTIYGPWSRCDPGWYGDAKTYYEFGCQYRGALNGYWGYRYSDGTNHEYDMGTRPTAPYTVTIVYYAGKISIEDSSGQSLTELPGNSKLSYPSKYALFGRATAADTAGTIKIDDICIRNYDPADTTCSIGTPEINNKDVVVYPGYDNLPTDPNADGLYEDVNGNGRVDFQDIMIFFQYNGWAAANQPNVTCWDWSGNGAIEFSDVSAFWESEFT